MCNSLTEPPQTEEDPNMAGAAAAENVAKSLTNLTVKGPDPFSGQNGTTATEFLRDFDDWLRAINKYQEPKIQDPDNPDGPEIDNPEYGLIEKQYLKQCLKDEAKQWYKNLDPDKPYKDVIEELKDTYDLTDSQKHSLKLRVYRMLQNPGENFKAFALRVKTAARPLDIAEEEICSILTLGAHADVRPYLLMAQKNTISELLKLPLAREEEQAAQDMEFVD